MDVKCCVFLLITSVLILCECKYGYVVWPKNELVLKTTDYFADIPDKYVARATYSNEINSTGWAFLELHTSADCVDEKQAFAAGYLEGYLTRDLIWYHWQNMLKGYCYNKTEVCGLIEEFVDKNEAYMTAMVEANAMDPYWYQVKLYYMQLEGLALGYNAATKDPYQWLSTRDIIWINMLGDLDEIAFAVSMPKTSPDGRLFGDRCTGLVKLLPDLSNLYFSHVTWNRMLLRLPRFCSASEMFAETHTDGFHAIIRKKTASLLSRVWASRNYILRAVAESYTPNIRHFMQRLISYQSMLRFHKMYVMHLRLYPGSKQLIPGYKMSFTSYPAFVQSTDDFYIISSGLATSETTIGNSNRTLFELITPVGSVLEYARAMIANRLARTGKEWTQIFSKYNSGTYNNQWFVVDYNKFKPRSAVAPGCVRPGLLWVVEQLPGITESADLTLLLKNQTYFPSYNIPYFPRIFNMSGGNVRIATYGDWFGYATNPRAKMLKEKQANIFNLRDMYHTMRYNDYKHDPLARCEQCDPPYSACNAVSARNDLNPANGTFPFRALGHRSHGATDVKITSAFLRTSYRFLAVCSPTYNISRGIPPFKWSAFDMGSQVSHVGQPDEWVFAPILHDWEWE